MTRLGEGAADAPELIWSHGWAGSGSDLLGFAEALEREYASVVLDLPGFGASAVPPETWGSSDYADALAEWLRSLPPRPRIWIGYSFGGRIGIQIAARHPDLLDGMILIAAAGLPPRYAFVFIPASCAWRLLRLSRPWVRGRGLHDRKVLRKGKCCDAVGAGISCRTCGGSRMRMQYDAVDANRGPHDIRTYRVCYARRCPMRTRISGPG